MKRLLFSLLFLLAFTSISNAQALIKAFNIGLKVDNILNQNHFVHTVSENFVQDSYTTSFGRLFLISLKYNFGKLNQAKSGSAQQAAFRMN